MASIFKPLNWKRTIDDPDSLWEANGIGGTYEIGRNSLEVFLLYPSSIKAIEVFQTIKEAEDAAEKNFQKQMKSMLLVLPNDQQLGEQDEQTG